MSMETTVADDGRPIRLAIDDDYPIVVQGLAAMLADHADRVEIVELGPDMEVGAEVVLKDAFAMTDDIEEYVAKTKGRVLIFAASDSAQAVRQALDKGAAGYVHKSSSVAALLDAIERVHSGEQVVEPELRSGDGVGTPDWPGRAEGLSDRESEVLALICQGMSNQQVAQTLYLSINSIKTYIRMLYRKIGAESRSQAVIWGLQHGFSPSPPSGGR
jgi:NarL family two-component system response regulator LiaR